MVQPSYPEDPPCGICDKPAKPYGPIWPHRFFSEVLGQHLCEACARVYLPDQVKHAEETEAR